MEIKKVSAPAKIILFGEHAVVYGQPAIAIPVLDIRAFVEILLNEKNKTPSIYAKDLDCEYMYNSRNQHPEAVAFIHNCVQYLATSGDIHLPGQGWRFILYSEIPIARGLGSSAAINIALIRAIYELLNIELPVPKLINLSYELEKFHHGRPSGIDNTVISLEKPILFQKEKEIRIINPEKFYFVVGDTGLGKKTAEVVSEVALNYKNQKENYDIIFQATGEIAIQGFHALETGNIDRLGYLMDENQKLLSQIGVSCPELDGLILAAKNNKAPGAKLCGAGQGGCMVALVDGYDHAELVADALIKAGAVNSYITVLQ